MPASSMPSGAKCATAGCHDQFAKAAFVHLPAAGDGCGVCHGPEQGVHKFPLVRPVNDLCRFCHAVLTGKSHPHQVVASGNCTACHNPHGASLKFLLNGPQPTICGACHAQTLTHRKFDHGPFATGACTACHQPHEADNPHLTIADGADNCFRCHVEVKGRLEASVVKHEPVQTACTTCHEPHTSDFRYTLKADPQTLCLKCHEQIAAKVRTAAEQHGALLMKDGCANCHDPHGSGEPKLLKDEVYKLCAACHNVPLTANDGREIRAVTADIARSAFLHGPVRQGQCQACHQVHGSSNKRLLASVFPATFYEEFEVTNYALCFSCHEKAMVMDQKTTTQTGFRNGQTNLHYLHVHREKGRTCKSCHEIHASNMPKHMATSVPFEGGGWTMPINFKKMPSGGSCAPGCHQAYTYDRDKPVEYPATRSSSP